MTLNKNKNNKSQPVIPFFIIILKLSFQLETVLHSCVCAATHKETYSFITVKADILTFFA